MLIFQFDSCEGKNVPGADIFNVSLFILVTIIFNKDIYQYNFIAAPLIILLLYYIVAYWRSNSGYL